VFSGPLVPEVEVDINRASVGSQHVSPAPPCLDFGRLHLSVVPPRFEVNTSLMSEGGGLGPTAIHVLGQQLTVVQEASLKSVRDQTDYASDVVAMLLQLPE